MRKKLLSALLALVLILSLAPAAAHAAADEMTAAANALYQLGLFNGTGKDAQGNPIFDLDRTPTRNEAVTMLVRLLGKENEAESNTWNTPFTDLANWAKSYVGYAYAHGLTNGTSETTFDGDGKITASQFITLVLRALGYESGPDFQWDKAWELSDKIGFTGGRYNANTHVFTRGDVVIICRNALSFNLKGKDTTLIDELTARGVVKEHPHSYVTKTVKRVEQVQVGTNTVVEYEYVTVYECKHCKATTTDYDENSNHIAPGGPCGGYGYMIKQKRQVVGIKEEPIYETKWVEETIKVCSVCGKKEPEAHTHNYVEKTVPGTGGHWEQVQVQVGTKTVNDYGDVTIYGCGVCSFTTYDGMEIIKHTDPRYEESKKVNGGHMGANWWSETKKVVVGTHEEPNYETRTTWVSDSATAIRVCSICGQQEP